MKPLIIIITVLAALLAVFFWLDVDFDISFDRGSKPSPPAETKSQELKANITQLKDNVSALQENLEAQMRASEEYSKFQNERNDSKLVIGCGCSCE